MLSSHHIRPFVRDRPDLADANNESGAGAGILLIDLEKLNAGGPERRKVVEAIGRACESDGFFMVTNHGIPAAVLEGMLRVAREEFLHLPESEKLKFYSDDPKKAIGMSTRFSVRTEKVSNWRDYLRLHCPVPDPLESFLDQWPANPPSFRQVVGDYATEARALALRLLEAISESLGLELSHMAAAMGTHAQHMAVNYYPPCPQPELTYGLPGHKDPNAITLLLQDGDISGLQLQVWRGGRWVAVNPVPSALVINIGDQMQALSNGRYKSVLHCVIVNSESERFSVPDAVISRAAAASAWTMLKKRKKNVPRWFRLRKLMLKGGGSRPLLPVVASPQRQAATPATATTTDHEDAMKLLMPIMIGATVAVDGFLVVKFEDITSSWETQWQVVYGISIMFSFLLAITSVYSAFSPAESRGRKFSSLCAGLGLLVAAGLVFFTIPSLLGPFGWIAGLPTAAVVVIILAVVWWICSARPARRVQPAPEE